MNRDRVDVGLNESKSMCMRTKFRVEWISALLNNVNMILHSQIDLLFCLHLTYSDLIILLYSCETMDSVDKKQDNRITVFVKQ